MDIRSESYFALDPTASVMWHELTLGAGRDETLRRLEEQFSSDPSELEADFDEFVQKCVARGLLTRAPEGPTETPQALPHTGRARRLFTLRAWWSLLETKLSLSRKGFSGTYNGALRMACPEGAAADDAQMELLSRALEAFATAENFFYLKRAPLDCLPRSLALFKFLRSAGLPVQHCIGVRPFPFSAHAWTECCGRVVHDDESNRKRFTVIARIVS
ncbi:MAG: lasso peptide biosynthesis B2 protein [Deltaproteobacteria bacterium]|nr:lasso peptide biosynthesis B2 protein [Deltaproteobacteria bacterium]